MDIQVSIMYHCMFKILLENKETQKNKQMDLKDNKGLKIMKVMKVIIANNENNENTTSHTNVTRIQLNYHITNQITYGNWLWVRTIDKAKNRNSLHTYIGIFTCFVFEYLSLSSVSCNVFSNTLYLVS